MVRQTCSQSKPSDVVSTLESIVKYHLDQSEDDESDDSDDSDESEENQNLFFYITLSALNKNRLTLSDLNSYSSKIYSKIGEGYVVDKNNRQVYHLTEKGIYTSPLMRKHDIIVSLCNHMFNEEPDSSYA